MLSGSRRKYLRGLAHNLRPKVQVGKEGLTGSVIDAVDAALEANELVKVQIAAERAERNAMVPVLERRTRSECVGQIGRMAILYRQHPDPEQRKIQLP